MHLRDLLRSGGHANRIFFFRCVDGAGLISAKTQDNVRAKDQDRGSYLPFMLRIQGAPNARLVQVVCQGFHRHMRDSREGQEVGAQGTIRSIGRTFAAFRVFVVNLA